MPVFSTYTQIFYKISKSWQLLGSLETFLYVLSPYNKMKKAASPSELSNALTHETIGQIEMITDIFFNPGKKLRHSLR